MIIVFKGYRDAMNFSFSLYINILCAIHHDFGNGVIFQKRLEWAKTKDLSCNLLEQTRPFRSGKNDIFLCQDLLKQILDCSAHIICPSNIHRGVQLGKKLILNAGFEIKISASLRRSGWS